MNFLGNFFLTYIQPHSYLWEPILRNALVMNWAKYLTLGAWVIYWLGFLMCKKQNDQSPINNQPAVVTDPRSKKPLIWVVVLYFVLYSFLWAEIGGLRDIPVLGVSFYPAAFTLGLILLIIGVISSIVARYYLGSGWSFLTIIKEGPYSFVRHPIYLGLFVIWLGSSLMFFNWIGMVSAFILLLPLLYCRAKIEEENLIKIFGIDYQNCINSTGSIFPKLF